jgi:hypothetical protein
MKSKTPTELTRATGRGLRNQLQGHIVRIGLALATKTPRASAGIGGA